MHQNIPFPVFKDLSEIAPVGFPGQQGAYGQPAVAGNRLFVGSGDGTVYALAADTGCLHWTFKASAQVRTAISIAASVVVFGPRWLNMCVCASIKPGRTVA